MAFFQCYSLTGEKKTSELVFNVIVILIPPLIKSHQFELNVPLEFP